MDIFKRTADVNLWGMIDVTKTFLPLVKKAQGRVVNFSSAAGKGYESISGFPWYYQIKIVLQGQWDKGTQTFPYPISTNLCNFEWFLFDLEMMIYVKTKCKQTTSWMDGKEVSNLANEIQNVCEFWLVL